MKNTNIILNQLKKTIPLDKTKFTFDYLIEFDTVACNVTIAKN